jgi:hypothetical protein
MTLHPISPNDKYATAILQQLSRSATNVMAFRLAIELQRLFIDRLSILTSFADDDKIEPGSVYQPEPPQMSTLLN